MSESTQPLGPCVPTSTSVAVLRPLGVDQVRLTGGLLADWQRRNHEVSLPMGVRQLHEAGNLTNLQLAAGAEQGEYRGPRFMDSDLYKTLEGIGWELGLGEDQKLFDFIGEVVELAEAAQADDGYLNSYVQAVQGGKRYTGLEHSHEMYCAGHLMQAAVAVYRCTQDRRLFDIAVKFADHLVREFLDGGNPGIDGHPEVETALIELYRTTGTKSYLDLAAHFLEERGKGLVGNSGRGASYFQDHATIRDADTLVGHAVRALYLDAGVVDLYLENGDKTLLDASVRRWEDMVATKTTLTGGLGSRHSSEAFGDGYELPPDRAYNETCAAIASIHWSWRLLLATGDGRYADLIERTLYNGFAASTSFDGNKFFYVNPLQRRADHREGDDPGRRHEWFSCACCPPNIMRLFSSLGHYVATTSDGALWLHQYANATIANGEVDVDVATNFPWSGDVTITVRAAKALKLRIPSWCSNYRLQVGGERVSATPDEQGYVTVDREWQSGDTVELSLDMEPRAVYPHRKIDALRGCVAFERGPLVYCVESIDQPDTVAIDDLAVPADARIRVVEWPDHEGMDRDMKALEFDAADLAAEHAAGLPYFDAPQVPAVAHQVTGVAVPYFEWDNRDGGPMRVWLPVV